MYMSGSRLHCCKTHYELYHPVHTLKIKRILKNITHSFVCVDGIFQLIKVIKLEKEKCDEEFEQCSWSRSDC